MKSINVIKKVLFVLFTLSLCFFIFNGCGYKPTNYYAKKELAGKVFVRLYIDLQDPRNAVIIKDSVNQLLVQKLGSKLVYDESLADTIMDLKIESVSMTEIQYDSQGYNKVYRSEVVISVKYHKKDEKVTKSFTLNGENNFSIGDDTTITDAKRFEAIEEASNDALDELLSKIAVSSFKK